MAPHPPPPGEPPRHAICPNKPNMPNTGAAHGARCGTRRPVQHMALGAAHEGHGDNGAGGVDGGVDGAPSWAPRLA